MGASVRGYFMVVVVVVVMKGLGEPTFLHPKTWENNEIRMDNDNDGAFKQQTSNATLGKMFPLLIHSYWSRLFTMCNKLYAFAWKV